MTEGKPFIEDLHQHFPVQKEPPINTMNKKLVVSIASPGWLSTQQNPHIPTSHEAMAQALIDSVHQGAAIVHMHAREEGGKPSEDPDVTQKILDRVLNVCPDVVTSTHINADKTKSGVDMFSKWLERITATGVKYIQGTPLHTKGSTNKRSAMWDDQLLRDVIPYLEDKGVKPELLIYDTFGIDRVAKAIEQAARWKPYWVVLNFGKHDAMPVGRDPWAHYHVMTMIKMTREMLPEETVLGAYIGGRNWLPLTVLAIMMGIDIVRVGVEDCLWVYPHRDEIIQSDADMVRKIVTIGRELGREIATPDDVRTILGLKKPAKS
ncbi:MAG: 3-keto-5-aminohexanoate cleavage protein [Desulfobacterales bacterium]|nr:3-keto-5-aminohexanoate cleavage protein [Desulfobacterales bacterium]